MKKFILAFIFILIFPSLALAVENEQPYSSANVKVILNGMDIPFDQEPVLMDNTLFVQIRPIAESLGYTVKWKKPDGVKISTSEEEILISINETRGTKNGRRPNNFVFFMEEPPLIINGHTMVPIRIMEVFGAGVSWDIKKRVATVTFAEDTNSSKQAAEEKLSSDNYYKLYGILIGGFGGSAPLFDEARQYVLEKNLLNTVQSVMFTNFTFCPDIDGRGNLVLGFQMTMVAGNDETGNEKAFWLYKNQYTGYIETKASVRLNDGISRDTAVSILKDKGVRQERIDKLYISPYQNEIVWKFLVDEDGQKYYYCLDYITGDMVVEKRLQTLDVP